MNSDQEVLHPGARVQGRTREVVFVILLSIVTVGLYLVYWYWINLVEMEGVSSGEGKKVIRYAKRAFILLAVAFALLLTWFILVAQEHLLDALTSGVVNLAGYLLVVPIDILFTVLFLRAVQLTQIHNGIENMPFVPLIVLYGFRLVLSGTDHIIEFTGALRIISGILEILLAFLFLGILQVQINRVWVNNEIVPDP